MCYNCGDFIDMCTEGRCYTPDRGPYGKARKFYVGDEYCQHLADEYGHRYAEWTDRYAD